MNLQRIYDSIYLIPVLLDHFENPSESTRNILHKNGINEAMILELKMQKNLLKYHKHIVQSEYQPDYELLRKGLSEYFWLYLKPVFERLEITDEELIMLDYGCGSGQYSAQFLRNNPKSTVILVDKEEPDLDKIGVSAFFEKVNFEEQPKWFEKYKDKFDLILLSEVLHCKSMLGQKYLIHSCQQMLKKKGQLLVIENTDYCMEYRISKIKKGDFKILSKIDLAKLMQEKFVLRNMKELQNHSAYLYEKI